MTLDESKKLLADMYDALNAQDLEAQHKYCMIIWSGTVLQVLVISMV